MPRNVSAALGKGLLLVVTTAIGVSGLLGDAAIADGIPGVTLGTETGAPPDQSTTAPADTEAEAADTAYTQAMLIGYAATEQEDYQTALINFRRALAARPGDRYALAAIANIESYIAQQRREIARQQRLATLRQQVDVAVSAQDWACAAATVDEMITLVPQNSLERSRLVTYRGELSSLLDARENINQWSTVCPG
jgi:tetratricopeptide (TPR) repeat protein